MDCRLFFIRMKVLKILNPSVATVMQRDGNTNAGAYVNTCVMYISEKMEPSPVTIKLEYSVEHKELKYWSLVDSSPALYFLKNSAGNESTRAMVADCIDILICVLTLPSINDFKMPISIVLILRQTENTITAQNKRMLSLGMTSSKIMWVILGESIPTNVVSSIIIITYP